MKLVFASSDFANVYLMRECAPLGDLAEDGVLEGALRHFVAHIVLALEYLYTFNALHRGLRPRNVLLFDDGSMKLGDESRSIISDRQRYVVQRPRDAA